MAKEKTFEHPPRGHVALLAYDPANDRFRVLEVESDTYPDLKVGIAKGAVQAHVAAPNADNFAASTPGLFVVGHLYGFDGTTWDRLRADAGELRVGQPSYANLRATVNNTPRLPPGVTDLSAKQSALLANGYYIELLSGTTATTFGGCSGRVVAAGRRICVPWAISSAGSTAGFMTVAIGYDTTIVLQIIQSSPLALFAPAVLAYVVGDGSRVVKICGRNSTGGTITTDISALCWEEDVF